jgi:hypothetical protein
MRPKRALLVIPVAVAATVAIAGCGGGSSSSTAVSPNSAEVSPPGDIPDNQVFVAYSSPGAGFSVKVPEGWSQTNGADGVTFTDKLNSVTISSAKASAPPTVAQAKSQVVPQLAKSVKGFANPQVSTVRRNAGNAVLITYTATGKPDPVTGKSVIDAVERYTFYDKGHEAILTLSGPQGADNVDPWRIVTDSLQWS